jgi:hypothetical protein
MLSALARWHGEPSVRQVLSVEFRCGSEKSMKMTLDDPDLIQVRVNPSTAPPHGSIRPVRISRTAS